MQIAKPLWHIVEALDRTAARFGNDPVGEVIENVRGVFGRIHTAPTAIVPNTNNVPSPDPARYSSRLALFRSPALPNFFEFRCQA